MNNPKPLFFKTIDDYDDLTYFFLSSGGTLDKKREIWHSKPHVYVETSKSKEIRLTAKQAIQVARFFTDYASWLNSVKRKK